MSLVDYGDEDDGYRDNKQITEMVNGIAEIQYMRFSSIQTFVL